MKTNIYPEKIGTKIYGRADGDRRDELDTTTPVVGKQHIILL